MKTVKAKLPKFIKRITILKKEEGSPLDAEQLMVVKPRRKRRKRSRGLVRVWERLARRSAKAESKTADTYLERHNRSNRKRRDGWLRDYSYNVLRARRKGGKSFRLWKIFR
jgi:hypothetical protein